MPEVYGHPYGDLVAAAQVDVVEGSATFTGNHEVYGFSAVVLNVDVVELTLGPDSTIDFDDALIEATSASNLSDMPHVEHASDSLIKVRVLDDASAPQERPFYIRVSRKGT